MAAIALYDVDSVDPPWSLRRGGSTPPREECRVRRAASQASQPSSEPADVALVEAARRGDRHALGLLHRRYAGMVHAILLARVPPGEADDLVQDVFLTVLQRLPELRDAGGFGAWLSTIARNCAIDLLRRRRPSQHISDELPERRPSPGAEAREMLDAVRSLPAAYRETLLMRFVEGMTGPEIAARTGLTEGSVRVNLCRGMQLLRDRIGSGGRT